MLLRVFTLLIVCLLAVAVCEAAPRERWWRNRLGYAFTMFDWNCASKARLPQRLQPLVRSAISPEDRDRPGSWGDRATVIRLRAEQPAILFVPTTCGGTGNCTWRLYESRTLRYLGELGGQFIYVRTSSRAWPMLVTYTHMSACEGILSRYEYVRGQYRWMKDDYAVNCTADGQEPLPGKLARTKRLCRDIEM